MNETFYHEFEVFSKRTPNAAFTHQFSLLAPNKEMALLMAQENFMRREPVVDIWVVKREDYRTTKGYGYLKKKWRHYEQQMLDEKEIMSWQGGDSK